jgi:hypothetical protein
MGEENCFQHYKPIKSFYTSLRADKVSMAIQYLVIADLSAITLNVFFGPAHLYRRSIFVFARIKREDLFELLFTTTSSATPEAKQKYKVYPKGTVQPARQVLCFLSYLLKKDGRSSL